MNFTFAVIFSGLGWGLLALGFLTCIVPKHFKHGVITMLLGDLCLVLSIAFPKKLESVFSFMTVDGMSSTTAITIGAVISILLVVASWSLLLKFSTKKVIEKTEQEKVAELVKEVGLPLKDTTQTADKE